VDAAVPLSREEVAAVDAAYALIPDFASWPQAVPREDLWTRAEADLDALKHASPTPGALDSAVRTAMRAAAFDTGAIEGLYRTDRGLTMTVATQAAAWEAAVDAAASDARAYFEAQLEAYELVLDVVTHARPVTEVWIRHLHEILARVQETYEVQTPVGPQARTLPRGRYKTDPNHVRVSGGSIHPYAPVDTTAPEMGRLVEQIGSDGFRAAHPVTQASYVHYCLAAIHPFADGNGRVARAVASIYFYRALSVPLVIFVDQREAYLSALEAADRGDREPFIRFIAEAGRAAVGMVSESMRTALGPQADDVLRELGSLLSAQGGLSHAQLDQVAVRLQKEIQLVVTDVVDKVELPPGVRWEPLRFEGASGVVPVGYRAVQIAHGGLAGGQFTSVTPADAKVQFSVDVAVSTSSDEAQTFVLFDHIGVWNGRAEQLVLGLTDVYPEQTVASQFRIRAFAERLVATALEGLVEQARVRLKESGYAVEQDP
jgi:Fic family protein